MKKGRKKESKIDLRSTSPELPSVDSCFCHRCGTRVGHPHFSAEDKPKVFCTWICAFKYHQVHNCGIYRIENNLVHVVEVPSGASVFGIVIDTKTMRPRNHPVRD